MRDSSFVGCSFACGCVLELVVCRVRFARVSCPRLRFATRKSAGHIIAQIARCAQHGGRALMRVRRRKSVADPATSVDDAPPRPLSVLLDTLNRTHDPSVDGDAIAQSFGRAYRVRGPEQPCRNRTNFGDGGARSGLQSLPQPPEAPGSSRATCADLRASRHEALAGVRLVLGVSSAPDKWGERRRVGIRETWLRWPSVGRSVVSCFVLGRRQLHSCSTPKCFARKAQLDQEQAQYDDIAWLNGTLDGQVMASHWC